MLEHARQLNEFSHTIKNNSILAYREEDIKLCELMIKNRLMGIRDSVMGLVAYEYEVTGEVEKDD